VDSIVVYLYKSCDYIKNSIINIRFVIYYQLSEYYYFHNIYRKLEKMNYLKFQKELQEIDERVAARPLLLEHSGLVLRKEGKTQEFYFHALQKAGFSDKEIRKFLASFQKEKSSTSDEQATECSTY